jgi:hypothetical protein
MVYEQQGRTGEAIEEFQKAISLTQGIDGVGSLGHAYAVSGKLGEAESTLRRFTSFQSTGMFTFSESSNLCPGLAKKALSSREGL